MTDVLSDITRTTRETIRRAKSETPWVELAAQLADAPPVRDFVAALDTAEDIGLIAEVKKASPSAGIIREDFDPIAIATTYAAAGAHCISCLTDEPYFQGRLEYLTAIRQHVSLPIMRKDFILDRYQVLEARVAGADCVLLIAECLTDGELQDLDGYAAELGMARLVELYDAENLPRVLDLSPELLGINNRNLRTFQTSLDHTAELAKAVPEGVRVVSESGIRSRADVEFLLSVGAKAILVGESLMRADDTLIAARRLLGTVAPESTAAPQTTRPR